MSYIDYDPYERAWYTRKRVILPLGALAVVSSCTMLRVMSAGGSDAPAASSVASVEFRSLTMSFEDCNAHIRTMAGTLGIAPVNIVEADTMRMVRFPASDGSVLVTCSAANDSMVVTRSDYQG